MSKRPAFQFYPSDWLTEVSLRLCSAGARSLWMDIMCLVHDLEPYGHLTDMGRPMAPEVLAKLVGESPAAVKRWLAELEGREVFSVTAEGVIYSRRMVRDEAVREARASGGSAGAEHGSKGAAHGSKGGRPKKGEGGSDAEPRGDKKPPLKPPPSTTSSSPSSEGYSEDKSSGAEAPVVVGLTITPDLDQTAWQSAVAMLCDQGKMTEKAARGFFGRLLSENGIRARDLFPAVTQAMVNRTQDPQGYLKGSAARIGKQGSGPVQQVDWI